MAPQAETSIRDTILRPGKVIPAALLFIAAWLAYGPFYDSPFQFDDALFLQDTNLQAGNWFAFLWPPSPRALTWLTFAAQYQWAGADAASFHVFNILIHALNCVLVFLWLAALSRRESQSLWIPFWGALLFAWHPLQTQAVFYVYQRSTLLATFFLLLALVMERRGRFSPALGFFALGLGCKEIAVAFPVAVWLTRGLLDKRWKPDRWLAACGAAALAVAAGFGLWVALSQEATLGGGLAQSARYAATQVQVIWIYLGLAFYPRSLDLDHDIAAASLADPLWWMALAGWVVLAALLWRFRRRFELPVLLASLYFVLLLPSSSFFPSRDFLFEHRVYPAMMAFCGMAALAVGAMWRKARLPGARLQLVVRIVCSAALLAVLGSSLWAVRQRGEVWSSPVSLWRDTVRKSPQKYRPQYNLGVLLIDQEPQQAEAHLLKAIAIEPAIPLAYRSLGQLYYKQESLEQARQAWEQALQIDPDDVDTQLALGRLFVENRDFQRAKQHLEQVKLLAPSDWRPYFYLARLHLNFSLYSRAARLAEEGLERNPVQSGLRFLLADAVRLDGNPARAVQLYRQGLESDPGAADAYFKMSQAYRQLGEEGSACKAVQQGIAAASGQPQQQSLGRSLLRQIGCNP